MQIYKLALIDYIKILVKSVNIEHLYSNPNLTFFRKVSTQTGEVKTKEIAHYHFCNITIYDNGTVIFKGSIHKFWNSLNQCLAPNYKTDNYVGFNGNLFNYQNLQDTIKHLVELFDCKPQQMIIRNVEFGINAEIDFNPNKFLKGLLFHNGTPFESQFNRNYYEVMHQQYKIKIYNKSYQYQMNNNVLRFELKYFKMLEIHKLGVFTLNDLTGINFIKIFNLLLKRFDEIVYFDKTIIENTLSKNEKTMFKNYSNLSYWIDDLKPNHRHRHKKRLKELIEKKSMNLHLKIKNELIKKCVIINQKL